MIGRTLGHYRILDQLGAGGMGVVYRARDERLERDIAVKVLPAGTLAGEADRRRFRKEALMLSQMSHPNIAVVHDFDSQDGTDFLVMELVPGEPLSNKLAAGALREQQAIQLGTQLLQGLAAAHKQGVVHRDLKPHNLQITPDGHLKILDFGLAVLRRPAADPEVTATLTQTQAVVGTLPYMSPEQLRGEKSDHRGDIYSAGVVLYEMIAGRRPFVGASGPQLVAAILQEMPPMPGGSPGLDAVVMKALEKDPHRRYQSAGEFLADLERAESLGAAPGGAFNDAPRIAITGTPSGTSIVSRRVVVLGAAAVAAMAFAVVFWRLKLDPGAPLPAQSRASLAVLPFRALTGQSSDSELGLGLADAIITGLGGSGDLIVRPTRAVLGYQDKLINPVVVGNELQVGVVLDGTIQKSGNRLRISVQLWQVSDGASVWAQKYDRQADDVFALQDEIGSTVAQMLRVELASAARQRLSRLYSKNPEVYSLILRGRLLALRENRQGLQTAMGLFEQAASREPDNALTHAWLAQTYRLYWLLFEPANLSWREKTRLHAQRAIDLDPNLAEAYAAQAQVAWSPPFDNLLAGRLFSKAVMLNPNLTERAYLGLFYNHVGLYDRATEELRRSIEVEPKNVFAIAALAENYLSSGQLDLAEEKARSALALDADNPRARVHLVECLIVADRLAEADALLKQNYLGASAIGSLKFHSARLAALLAARRRGFAEAERLALQAAEQAEGFGHFHHIAFTVGQVYALAGKKPEAVAWLRRSAEMPNYPLYRSNPYLQNLQSDPDYERFVDQVRVEWERLRRELQ